MAKNVSESVLEEIRTLSSQFSRWDEVMRRYDKHLYVSVDGDVSDEDVSMMHEVIGVYATILKVCTSCGHFRDRWNLPVKFSLTPFGHEVIVQSSKMGARFELGRYHREVFLNSFLLAPSYINRMGDEFWACFVELHSTGNFSFQENASPSSEKGRDAMKRFKNTKSNIFKSIRNFILLETFEGNVDDLGSLQVSWPATLGWSELITQAVKAFRCLYKINYMLYKHGGPAFDADLMGYKRWAPDSSAGKAPLP